MSSFHNPSSRVGRVKRARNASSAAAFAGCIGLPDPGHGPRIDDGGLYAFAARFNEVAGAWLSERSPECRTFEQHEREAAAVFRR